MTESDIQRFFVDALGALCKQKVVRRLRLQAPGNVTQFCEKAGIARGTYYYWLKENVRWTPAEGGLRDRRHPFCESTLTLEDFPRCLRLLGLKWEHLPAIDFQNEARYAAVKTVTRLRDEMERLQTDDEHGDALRMEELDTVDERDDVQMQRRTSELSVMEVEYLYQLINNPKLAQNLNCSSPSRENQAARELSTIVHMHVQETLNLRAIKNLRVEWGESFGRFMYACELLYRSLMNEVPS